MLQGILRGFYGYEVLTETELVEQLLEEVVDQIVEFDKVEIERAISHITMHSEREMVQNYLDYLERLIESLD